MNISDCPQPRKRSYTTKDQAQAAASVKTKPTYPYRCQCGAWHLTTKRPTGHAVVASDDDVEFLLNATDAVFAAVAGGDVLGRARPELAAALRHKSLTHRWYAYLQGQTTDLLHQLTLKKHDQSPETQEWRASVIARQGQLHGRLLEVRALREDRRREHDELRAAQKLSPDHRAAVAARKRLVQNHVEEYVALLNEERAARGLPVKEIEDPSVGGSSPEIPVL